MVDQEVDTWVRNTTSAVATSPDNTIATGRSSGFESSVPTSESLGSTATPLCQSDMPNACPFPFPLPKDFLRMEVNVPNADISSIYLQRRSPICFSGIQNFGIPTC